MATDSIPPNPLTLGQRVLKRAFDICAAATGLALTGPFIAIAALAARIDTGASGFFRQQRTGLNGSMFDVIKIRTMRAIAGTTVTTSRDPRITWLGHWFRKLKIDELPQLWNVLKGDMSLVGPRPDVKEYTDLIHGDEKVILAIRPGITGPATLQFRNEQELLAQQDEPEIYNREVIFPEKIRLNIEYVQNYSFVRDIGYILRTIVG